MSTLSPQPTVTHDQFGRPLDEVTQRGLEIYNGRLKSLLEPAQNGRVVAIHVDTGDYVVADSSPEALRAMRKIHPTGLLFRYTIGPAEDYGLARRMAGIKSGTLRK